MVDDGRTTDGRTTEHGYTISSPCEPDGSGELNICFHKVRLLAMYFLPKFSCHGNQIVSNVLPTRIQLFLHFLQYVYAMEIYLSFKMGTEHATK